MGGDFTYTYADMYLKNLDKLIRYVNERNGTNYNAFYSTPSCYLKSLNEQNLKWPAKTDDFFPYSSDPHAFWTGYFSSRPTLKFFERLGNNFLQIVKQLSVLTNEPDTKELQLFREAMGVMQHHDAITGTEKQHVAEDYARLLHYSFKNGESIASKAINKWAMKKQPKREAEFNTCLLLNISSCEHSSENKKFVVTVYNPTSQPLATFVRLPVQGASYAVRDHTGKELVTQVLPISDQVKNIPGRFGRADNELLFEAAGVAPLGFQSFYVTEATGEMQSDEPVVNNKTFSITMTPEGRLAIRSARTGKEIVQSFHYYEGAAGSNQAFEDRSSGAYIFRPKENFAKNFSTAGTFNVVKGPLVEEGRYVINDWVSQIVKVYKNKPYVECDWIVGPIPVRDAIGKEIITRYSSDLKNHAEFFTDSNGREMLRRRVNYRPTWEVHLEEPISGNYYPVTSKILIEDQKERERLAVLTDRAQGGTSLKEGEIELMLHRRLLMDDAFGVGEALNESAYGEGLVTRGQHYILDGSLDNVDEVVLAEKELAVQLALRPWIFVTPTLDSFDEYNEYYEMKGDGLVGELPRNVQILTLEPWKDGEVLLRLEHIFEKDETRAYSIPAQVDLKNIFSGFTVQSVQETTLGANKWAKDKKRLDWQLEVDDVVDNEVTENTLDASYVVTLKPMEIRTFVVKLAPGTTSA
ncbi:lysosomal alpha-mannosidase isoform X2 [Copidosoma floridanum]|uniref:lysosomal alpha-mannosidase isoform X2 n=1 Tax=Copidosoma floridanum TaxID=29053 RepID=UPI0006C9CB9B|nr:lysosomal alpha-mannosidase isoform X2 [Copidosoma floridanum]